MKIIFTKHATQKLLKPVKKGLKLSKEDITNTVKNPDQVDYEIDYPKIIAIKDYDQRHVIRVVFRRNSDIITVITFYPARQGRYEEK